MGWGTGPKKFTEQFAYLMPFKGHVTLGFYRGGELPDPEGPLPTSGGKQASLIEAATRTGIPEPADT